MYEYFRFFGLTIFAFHHQTCDSNDIIKKLFLNKMCQNGMSGCLDIENSKLANNPSTYTINKQYEQVLCFSITTLIPIVNRKVFNSTAPFYSFIFTTKHLLAKIIEQLNLFKQW